MSRFLRNFKMDLSVIVVSYNTKKLTENCIKSVLKEKQSLTLEIIVMDNNSEDGSVETLRVFKKKGQIRLIENDSNTGFSFANNQGIKVARGRHVLLLNSDTVVKKGALKKLIDFADSHEEAGVVASQLLNADGSIQPSCFYFPTVKNAILEFWFGKKGLFEKYAPKTKKPVVVDAAVGASFLMTRIALKKVGMLDEKYFFYFEDIDYCRQVKQSELKVYYLPDSKVVHYHGASGKKIADPQNQWRRLIPSSKIYHGVFRHHLIGLIIRTGQKMR